MVYLIASYGVIFFKIWQFKDEAPKHMMCLKVHLVLQSPSVLQYHERAIVSMSLSIPTHAQSQDLILGGTVHQKH